MKRKVLIIFLFLVFILGIKAQDKYYEAHTNRNPNTGQIIDPTKGDSLGFPTGKNIIDTAQTIVPSIYAWKITPRLGERIFVPRDTLTQNFHNSMLVDGKSVAMGYLGNIGSPAQSKIFFERPENSRFMFLDAMYLWRKNPEDQYFLNTKVPYTNIFYQSGGGGESQEQRFQAEMSMNAGKKLNVGFDFDYIYSRGFYNSLANKGVSYDFYASYIGDKYKMHAFFHNNNFVILENGGVSDTTYISNPNHPSLESIYTGKSRDIPTRMEDTRNKMRGRHLYVTNRYDLGNDMEQYQVNDSTTSWRKKKDYVPLASVILTTHYTDQRRRITSNYAGLNNVYSPSIDIGDEGVVESATVKYMGNIDDYMSYYSFKNTLALAMNEGFRPWVKFGLTAFIEYDKRQFSIPGALPGIYERKEDDAMYVGGVLTKEKGRYLKYRASGQFDLKNTGKDFKLEGEISTRFSLFGKNVEAKADAYIKKVRPSIFQENFSSKYWNWNKSFSSTDRWYAGGEIVFPETSFSRTKISGGVENIKNYIYYGDATLQNKYNAVPVQYNDNVQIISLRLDQDFTAGIFHWDNQVVFQNSTKEEVIPLPQLSVYSNIYLMTKIAKVLTLQLGADVHYHSEYYMPGYDPLTMQFFNQREMKLGNYPQVNAYINLHLKYTRFFLMMYNATKGLISDDSFSLYRYPHNPRVLKLGISWQFNN
ncbi:hypothetical protein GGR21_002125 [Dysgonomonas hofstadii]|uniref:Porin n=1 Tax=Dysgonomonas hofstadii TaxID=637886 RepID=A0A840CRK1_9BACT|nr:putative porin [Dysgonomonas hofstadii]MBB4036224.1 hypothetical protein [Dysgonomonas hofstadii]